MDIRALALMIDYSEAHSKAEQRLEDELAAGTLTDDGYRVDNRRSRIRAEERVKVNRSIRQTLIREGLPLRY